MERSELEAGLEAQLESLGYELVELEHGGSKNRPVLRLRIDRAGSDPDRGVTIDDCARVSRSLEAWLESGGEVGERYVLEVSSPGLERPLVKRRDFERFTGREVVLKTREPVGTLGKRVEGILRGVHDEDGTENVRLEVPGGEVVTVPRDRIVRANLVFRWGE